MIVPFNWPIAILGASLPHALLAGNTAIVKPPPSAPLATTRVVQRVAEKLPPGVLNVVTGKDENMAGLIQNTDVAKVCFTGSVNGGKRIMEMASKTLTRVTLELGGNDAAVFLEDAILDDTHLDRLYAAIYDTTGQICMNAKRSTCTVRGSTRSSPGWPRGSRRRSSATASTRAPRWARCTRPRRRRSSRRSSRRRRMPAPTCASSASCPGGELAGGNFVRPAIVVDPDPELRVVTQEQFGPVIPIIPFDTRRRRCGSRTTPGAGSAARSGPRTPSRRSASASQLVCGYVWVNDHGATRLDLRAPFGGMKQSGIGREQGIEGVRAFQDTRSIATIDPAADPA